MIGKHLKDYKKAYLNKRKEEHPKSRIKGNPDWKKRWLPFIKYDCDFDGMFLIELIVHKLHIMLDYYDHGKYCWQVDESRLEIVKQLEEACRLGELIVDNNFEGEAFKIMHEHQHIWSEPCKDDKSLYEIKSKWDSEEYRKLYEEEEKKAYDEREKTIDEFFSYIRDHFREWWD